MSGTLAAPGRALLLALLLGPGLASQLAAQVRSPDDAFGFAAGADYEVADYGEMQAYFQELAQASPRVAIREIGRSAKGHPMLLLFISSAENIGALDEVSEADCRDALKELANVTCGLVTPIIASDLAEVFELSIPCIKDTDDVPTWHAWTTDPEACLLNVEGHLIVAKLTMHDSCPISSE